MEGQGHRGKTDTISDGICAGQWYMWPSGHFD